MDLKKHILEQADLLPALMDLRQNPLPETRLLTAKIKLLWQCNLACTFCELPPAGPPMTLSQVQAILVQLRTLGTKKVHFSGGEVFLHPEILSILSCAADLGFQVNLTSNGTLIDKDTVRKLVQLKIHAVSLSVDAAASKRHDDLRGQKGSFKATLKALHLLADHPKGPKLRVNTVVCRQNADDLAALHDLLMEISDQIRWRLILIHSQDPEKLLSKAMLKRIFEQAKAWPLMENQRLRAGDVTKLAQPLSQGRYGAGGQRRLHCYMPWIHVFIDPAGYVYPCCRSRGQIPALGNSLTEELAQILAGTSSQTVRMGMAVGHPMEVCHCCDDFLEDNELIETLFERAET